MISYHLDLDCRLPTLSAVIAELSWCAIDSEDRIMKGFESPLRPFQ